MEIKQMDKGNRGAMIIKTIIECPLNPPDESAMCGKDKEITLYKTYLVHLDNVPAIVKRFCEYNPHIDSKALKVEFIPKPIQFWISV